MTSLMSPSPEKMTSMSELERKCLEVSQTLINQGQTFKFSITSGTFSFSLESRGATTKVVERKVKKLSPSQVKRNKRRKEEFLKKKSAPPEEPPKNQAAEPNSGKEHGKVHECDHCEKTFDSENGLKIHKGKTHKEVLRSRNPENSPLQVSPEKETPREEQCDCCGEIMSPSHQCEEDEDEEPVSSNLNCEYCGKTSETKENHAGHMRWHTIQMMLAITNTSKKL